MTPTSVDNEIVERFWARVNKESECWIWRGAPDKDGYGRMRVGERRMARAPRIAWIIEHGSIPKGLFVLHRCDNPPCVRPSHLFLGTSKDNAVDRMRKGRSNTQRGIDRYNAKLSPNLIHQIIQEYIPTVMTQQMLADKYNVSQSTISNILRGDHWRHVKRNKIIVPVSESTARGDRAAKKINAVIAKRIRTEYAEGGISQQKLADKFGIAQTGVSLIVRGVNWV